MTASIDDRITIWIATHRWSPLNDVFVGLGTIEKLGAVWIALALVFALVERRGVRTALAFAAFTALVTFLADAASFGVKDLVTRPRPFVAHEQIHPLYTVHSSSFPAGHATTAFAGAVLLSWFARRWTPLFVALAVAVGFSRVYVGDHYVGDVIAGAFLGALVGFASLAALPPLRRAARRISATGRRPRAAAGSGSRP
jgi:membrane-associated phospholipid phosphatase